MASSNNSLNVSSLNFDEIKQNLKDFVKSKSDFTDFDFEGSTMSFLLDVLSYNTYYQSFYLNMVANEMFLDSAVMPESGYSISKALNYLPRSARSSHASLIISFNPNDAPDEIVIPKYSKFQTTIDGVNYEYTTDQQYSVSRSSNAYIKSIDIHEGIVLSYTFVYSSNGTSIFELPVEGVDTTSIIVEVYPNSTSSIKTVYSLVEDSTNVTTTTTAYYLQKNSGGFYEVYFGDNILGKALEDGNVVKITFRATNGDKSNGAKTFKAVGYTGYNRDNITQKYVANIAAVTLVSTEGQNEESLAEIKFNAPRSFERQNRLITADDYKQYIVENYSDIQSVSVWGGDTHSPPIYGKTIISVKPKNGYTISNLRKETIIADISELNPMAIDPIIIDPIFLFVQPSITAYYNATNTNQTAEQLYNKISTSVKRFETQNLGIFGNRFRKSRLSSAIDNSDVSIESNDLDVTIEKRFSPVLNSKYTYKLDFQNPLYNPYSGFQGCVSSTGFKVLGSDNTMYLDDDGKGTLRLYFINGVSKSYFNTNVGTVDYAKGILLLQSFTFTEYLNDEIRVSCVPNNADIFASKNLIILLSYPRVSMYDTNQQRVIYTNVIDVTGNYTLVQTDGILSTVVL